MVNYKHTILTTKMSTRPEMVGWYATMNFTMTTIAIDMKTTCPTKTAEASKTLGTRDIMGTCVTVNDKRRSK